MTQPAVMQEDLVGASDFWEGWDRLMKDKRFAQAEEPARLEGIWRSLCGTLPKGRLAETDTYLAAFALAGGYRLVTFDKGFARFDGLETEIL